MVTYWDDDYPLLLKKIYDTPVLLYIKGEPLKEREDCVAIVGIRRFTPYGKSATQTIAKDLESRNIAVVSGLARGIDTIAHKRAEQLILEVLGQDPVHIDALAQSVDIDITSLLEILLKLELKNAVQQIGGKQFVRA